MMICVHKHARVLAAALLTTTFACGDEGGGGTSNFTGYTTAPTGPTTGAETTGADGGPGGTSGMTSAGTSSSSSSSSSSGSGATDTAGTSSSTTGGGTGDQPPMGQYSHCLMPNECAGGTNLCFTVTDAMIMEAIDGFCSNTGCQDPTMDCDPTPGAGTAVPICYQIELGSALDCPNGDECSAVQMCGTNMKCQDFMCALDCSGGMTCPDGMICHSLQGGAMLCA